MQFSFAISRQEMLLTPSENLQLTQESYGNFSVYAKDGRRYSKMAKTNINFPLKAPPPVWSSDCDVREGIVIT